MDEPTQKDILAPVERYSLGQGRISDRTADRMHSSDRPSDHDQAGIPEGSERIGGRDIDPRADHVPNHHADQGDQADRSIRRGGFHVRIAP